MREHSTEEKQTILIKCAFATVYCANIDTALIGNEPKLVDSVDDTWINPELPTVAYAAAQSAMGGGFAGCINPLSQDDDNSVNSIFFVPGIGSELTDDDRGAYVREGFCFDDQGSLVSFNLGGDPLPVDLVEVGMPAGPRTEYFDYFSQAVVDLMRPEKAYYYDLKSNIGAAAVDTGFRVAERVCQDRDEGVAEFIERVGDILGGDNSIIIKPDVGMQGRGMQMVGSVAELEVEALANTAKAHGRLVAEEFITLRQININGQMVDHWKVRALAIDGLCGMYGRFSLDSPLVSQSHGTNEFFDAETRDSPLDLHSIFGESVKKYSEKVGNGIPTALDLAVDVDGQPVVFEINVRDSASIDTLYKNDPKLAVYYAKQFNKRIAARIRSSRQTALISPKGRNLKRAPFDLAGYIYAESSRGFIEHLDDRSSLYDAAPELAELARDGNQYAVVAMLELLNICTDYGDDAAELMRAMNSVDRYRGIFKSAAQESGLEWPAN